jgi:DNA-binding NarL/FixJ family response regulator
MTTLKAGNELWSSKMANLSNLPRREIEILRLVLVGKTNKAIADEDYLCKKTVEFHLDHIYTKIGDLK